MMGTNSVRIAKVEAIALSASFEEMFGCTEVPDWLRHPAASHHVQPRRGQFATLVKIHGDEGTVGVGECYGLPAPEVTATIVKSLLAPLILDQEVMATSAVWERMYQGQAAGGHTRGFYLEAMAGIDTALWDLKGKLLGLPVHQLLGGPIRSEITCYASPVALHADPDVSAEQARGFVADGFRSLKVKIGRGPREDGRHLRAVRAAVGDDVSVLVDANCAFTVDTATEVARVLRDNDISWFEEPLAVDDLDGLAELRRRTGLTMVNGETNFTRFDLRECLTRNAIDVYMPNVARSGGFTESMRIAAMASAHHVDIAPHGVGSGVSLAAALQLCAAIPNLRTYEYNRLPNALREAILLLPPVFQDGALQVPRGPGLGIELDEDVIDRFTVVRL